MKSKIALLLCLFFSVVAYSQTVRDVRIEIKNEKVFIFYKMPKLSERVVVNVSIWCSNDGSEPFLVKELTGDAGWDVRGGKYQYKAVWDVWRQIKKLKNAEFSVKAELVRMEAPEEIVSRGGWYFGYNGSYGFEKQSLGMRAGYFGKVGGYGALSVDPQDPGVGTITGGVTLKIIQEPKVSLHGYSGIGLGDFFDEFTFETGLVGSLYGFTIAIGSNIEFGVFESNLVIGAGWTF